jgi:hypothetical protein
MRAYGTRPVPLHRLVMEDTAGPSAALGMTKFRAALSVSMREMDGKKPNTQPKIALTVISTVYLPNEL